MKHPNTVRIQQFFEAYGSHDFDAIRKVMSADVIWTFLGQHPLAGVKNGIEEVVAFFDNMAAVMGQSNSTVDRLVTGVNDHYCIECQHIRANHPGGNNIDHHVCVLWTFEHGLISAGRHFFADPHASDHFFAALAPIPVE